jgi:hypothetical protein
VLHNKQLNTLRTWAKWLGLEDCFGRWKGLQKSSLHTNNLQLHWLNADERFFIFFISILALICMQKKIYFSGASSQCHFRKLFTNYRNNWVASIIKLPPKISHLSQTWGVDWCVGQQHCFQQIFVVAIHWMTLTWHIAGTGSHNVLSDNPTLEMYGHADYHINMESCAYWSYWCWLKHKRNVF